MATLAVVTPWFDHEELLPDYMEAVAWADEVIVVDDGSDQPPDFASLDATVIRLDYNRGFAPACNAGLAAATSDIVVFLNNDVMISDDVDWTRSFRQHAEPGVLCGPLRREIHAEVDGQPMPYIDGWCLAGWRTDLLELDGFDEGYLWPGDFTDNDLSLRARADGMTLLDIRPTLVHKIATTIGHRTATDRLSDSFRANQDRYVRRARELLAVTA